MLLSENDYADWSMNPLLNASNRPVYPCLLCQEPVETGFCLYLTGTTPWLRRRRPGQTDTCYRLGTATMQDHVSQCRLPKVTDRKCSYLRSVGPYNSTVICIPSNFIVTYRHNSFLIVQELCESRGGRPGLSVLTSLMISVDVKQYWTMFRHWSQLIRNVLSTGIRGH